MKKEIPITESSNKINDDAIEYCVLCGKDTGYVFSTNIEKRNYYVQGSGQLCKDCYLRVYQGTSVR